MAVNRSSSFAPMFFLLIGVPIVGFGSIIWGFILTILREAMKPERERKSLTDRRSFAQMKLVSGIILTFIILIFMFTGLSKNFG